MTAVLLARVDAFGGEPAVSRLLREASSGRTPRYLRDISNWISYDEALSLWRTGAAVTHHPQFARAVGEDMVARLTNSHVTMLQRSLGSPEAVYRHVAKSASKYSLVSRLQAVEVGPGCAEIVAVPAPGFRRSADHCAWTVGMLSQPTLLFGLAPAHVEHDQCAAFGAHECRFHITWAEPGGDRHAQPSQLVESLRAQLRAMDERLASVSATAADLLNADDIDAVLARITERAAADLNAPRCLLAVRVGAEAEPHCHHTGFDQRVIGAYVRRLLERRPGPAPQSSLVAEVRSRRHFYGRLLAVFEPGQSCFDQERELLEVYAGYAASALEAASALTDAKRSCAQSSALLGLARRMAAAGCSAEVARRLADAVPDVVDCDRVGVYLWDAARGELVTSATYHRDPSAATEEGETWHGAPAPGGPLEQLLRRPSLQPVFVDPERGGSVLREALASIGAAASILIPLATPESFLGMLIVSVTARPERLRTNPDLLNRLTGVAAQATTALQNGRLLDEITHQAQHDGLTGLANRLRLNEGLRAASACAPDARDAVTLFYIDLDGFKPVNDQLGHQVGDELLVAVAGRLSASTRADDLVARLGGDEFAVLIVGSEHADAVAQRLVDVFSTPFSIHGHELAIGASIGRAVLPTSPGGADDLLRLADAAMFETKRARREAALQPRSDR